MRLLPSHPAFHARINPNPSSGTQGGKPAEKPQIHERRCADEPTADAASTWQNEPRIAAATSPAAGRCRRPTVAHEGARWEDGWQMNGPVGHGRVVSGKDNLH